MKKTITLILLFTTCFSSIFAHIKPEDVLWGFDGKVIVNRFNPLSIMVSNPTPTPFDGQIQLEKKSNMGTRIGAVQVQYLFLGPYAHKWIQFHPYIHSSKEKWVCSWGRKKGESFKVPGANSAPPAVVFFTTDSSFINYKKIKIKTFKEFLFPPSVSLTSGLKAVVLNEAPEFTPLQNEAFYNWVKGGGHLFLMKDNSGLYPKFQGKCKSLNFKMNFSNPQILTSSSRAFFSGKITELSGELKLISKKTLGLLKIKPPKKKIKKADKGKKKPKKEEFSIKDNDYKIAGLTDELFRKLKNDVKVNHNWWIIAFITIIYLLLIVVGNYIIARKTRKLKWPMLFFIITVVIFSMIFAFIGQRGYGEKSQLSTISYAKDLGEGNFDVSQWINIFVTSGDYYKISHSGNCDSYSTCQTYENVNGMINNGSNGVFMVDIPLFSSRSLYHRSMMNAINADIESSSFKIKDGMITKCNIKLNYNFPGDIRKAIILYNKNVYTLTISNKSFKHIASHETIKQYYDNWSTYSYHHYNKNDNFMNIVTTMLPGMIFRSKQATSNLLDIYILADSPNTFKSSTNKISTENGATLYHFTKEVE